MYNEDLKTTTLKGGMMNVLSRRFSVLVAIVMAVSCHNSADLSDAGQHRAEPSERQNQLKPDHPNINGAMPLKGAYNKAGQELMALYQEYQAYLKQSPLPEKEAESFKPRNALVRVTAGSTIIDAAASGDPQKLAADLRSLGAQKITVFGRMVSCRLPISAIPALNELSSLQFARPAYTVRNPGIVK